MRRGTNNFEKAKMLAEDYARLVHLSDNIDKYYNELNDGKIADFLDRVNYRIMKLAEQKRQKANQQFDKI